MGTDHLATEKHTDSTCLEFMWLSHCVVVWYMNVHSTWSDIVNMRSHYNDALYFTAKPPELQHTHKLSGFNLVGVNSNLARGSCILGECFHFCGHLEFGPVVPLQSVDAGGYLEIRME